MTNPVHSRAAFRAAVPLFVLALAAGCSGDAVPAGDAAQTQPTAYKVSDEQRAKLNLVTLSVTRFRPRVEVTGTVAFNGDHSTQVLSPISGPVARLLVQPGAIVRAGEPLATVSSPDFAAAVAGYRKAEEVARNAERILKRDEQLFENDALARSDLDQARTDAASAAADVGAALEQLRSLGVQEEAITAVRDGKQAAPVEGAIRSPIAGTLVEKLINPGQLLQAGATPAFTVADLATMWVFASVYERDLALVAEGNAAEIGTDALAKPVPGRVDYVAAIVDPGTKATSVRIVADNRARVLKRDMFVRVSIQSARERSGLLVPAQALLRDDDNLPFVYVARPDRSFERHRVTVGYPVGDRFEITTGLATGDQVVADGALFLQFAEDQ